VAVAIGGFVVGALGTLFAGQVLPRLTGNGEIRGDLRIIDGDSIVVGGVIVRIKGIDAPESRQTCRRAGMDWRCGAEATERLRALIADQPVVCTRSGTDRNQRVLGYCRAGRIADIGQRMVRDGWAVSFDHTYAREEREAEAARRGIWASEFVRPQQWRRERVRAAGDGL